MGAEPPCAVRFYYGSGFVDAPGAEAVQWDSPPVAGIVKPLQYKPNRKAHLPCGQVNVNNNMRIWPMPTVVMFNEPYRSSL